MFLSHEIRVRGGKGMYLAPLKALAQEKIDDWTPDKDVEDLKHHFNDLKISICTGDYRLTHARKQELEESNLVLMTSEMLNSRCRNFKSEQNNCLCDIGTIVVDEAHLLTVPNRGDKLEVGLMKLSQIAPNCRMVLLSATMPNVDQISEWVSYSDRTRYVSLFVKE
jgi:replicative superfamily II helicase